MTTIKIIFFLLATVGVVYISRDSLRVLRLQAAARPHGFYRFFAWESIILLVTLNMNVWFREALSWHQIISWALLVGCLFPVILGMRLLRQVGQPDENRNDIPLIGLEKTTELVTVGIYRYIRHPLYSSLLLLVWGVFFKQPSWLGALLAAAASSLLLVTARVEERENMRFFGLTYQDYMKRTKRFIPFIF